MGFKTDQIYLRDLSVVVRYAVAGMVTLAALGIHLAFNSVEADKSPYLPFVLAILIASRFGGRGPGAAATILATLAVDWFFIARLRSFAVSNWPDGFGLALFVLVGVLTSLLTRMEPAKYVEYRNINPTDFRKSVTYSGLVWLSCWWGLKWDSFLRPGQVCRTRTMVHSHA